MLHAADCIDAACMLQIASERSQRVQPRCQLGGAQPGKKVSWSRRACAPAWQRASDVRKAPRADTHQLSGSSQEGVAQHAKQEGRNSQKGGRTEVPVGWRPAGQRCPGAGAPAWQRASDVRKAPRADTHQLSGSSQEGVAQHAKQEGRNSQKGGRTEVPVGRRPAGQRCPGASAPAWQRALDLRKAPRGAPLQDAS
jgi:hypothetical protein